MREASHERACSHRRLRRRRLDLPVILQRKAVHALLYLIVSFFALAVAMLSLGAAFAAALEVVVYAGAILVLFVFVVMMIGAEEPDPRAQGLDSARPPRDRPPRRAGLRLHRAARPPRSAGRIRSRRDPPEGSRHGPLRTLCHLRRDRRLPPPLRLSSGPTTWAGATRDSGRGGAAREARHDAQSLRVRLRPGGHPLRPRPRGHDRAPKPRLHAPLRGDHAQRRRLRLHRRRRALGPARGPGDVHLPPGHGRRGGRRGTRPDPPALFSRASSRTSTPTKYAREEESAWN